MKLLIVDDEFWSRRLIRNLLPWREYGIDEMFEADDGQQAIDLLSKHQVDIMITDMRMPGVDGAMLLQHLHDNDIDIETIVMSGYEDYKYLHAALKTKAVDYLLKPIVKEELHAAVITAINRINRNKGYTYLADILQRDDVREEFHRYYELRNDLQDSVSKGDDLAIVQLVDKIHHAFFTNDGNAGLIQFILSDLKRTVLELEQENHLIQRYDDVIFPDGVKDRLLLIAAQIRNQDSSGKMSILAIQKYIANHLSDNLTLSDLADKHFVSKEHLARTFKKETGLSVQAYIMAKKIDLAKRLLTRHANMAVASIALMCGYADIHYFYRVFRKVTGATPIQYREKHQYSATNTSKTSN